MYKKVTHPFAHVLWLTVDRSNLEVKRLTGFSFFMSSVIYGQTVTTYFRSWFYLLCCQCSCRAKDPPRYSFLDSSVHTAVVLAFRLSDSFKKAKSHHISSPFSCSTPSPSYVSAYSTDVQMEPTVSWLWKYSYELNSVICLWSFFAIRSQSLKRCCSWSSTHPKNLIAQRRQWQLATAVTSTRWCAEPSGSSVRFSFSLRVNEINLSSFFLVMLTNQSCTPNIHTQSL